MNIQLLKKLSYTKPFADGDIIIQDGDSMGNDMYIMLTGSAGVYKNYGEPNEILLRTMQPGDFFGEMTLFLNKERTATIAAQGAVNTLVIGRMNAYEFFESQPATAAKLAQSLYDRLCGVNSASGITSDITVLFHDQYKYTDWAGIDFGGKNSEEIYTAIRALCEALDKINKLAVQAGAKTDFFPDGHKVYALPISRAFPDAAYQKKHTCPVCGLEFAATVPRHTKLKTERVDGDFRIHYKDFEIVHYEIITCTGCYYSAFWNNFTDHVPDKFAEKAAEILPLKQILGLKFDEERDINDVFAGLYLTIRCAPLFLMRPHSNIAKAWLRLHWLYQDCEDTKMADFAAAQARYAYLALFEKADLPAGAVQQVCLIIGELCFKLGGYDEAKRFFFMAKSNKDGKEMALRMAEDRLAEIREIEKR